MEELCFREMGDDTEVYISFTPKPPTVYLPWPIPRAGEQVSVRAVQGGVDKSISGIVDHVEWYFSSGNNGSPVVTVWVRKQDK